MSAVKPEPVRVALAHDREDAHASGDARAHGCDRELRQSEKLEAVALLAEGIAHQLNNILSVISVCAEEVLASTDAEHPNLECLADIRSAIERGTTITRDLLSFSQRSIGEIRVIAFDELVTTSERAVADALGDVVTVETALGATHASVRVDPAQWTSVFANLAVNARHAMPDGGTLSLRSRELVVDPATRGRSRPTGRYVELEVADTGCGIAHELQPRIFDPFFTTQDPGRGTGLGLSVVHGIVERSGGWIEVSSAPGRGATFRIYVPVADAHAVSGDRRPEGDLRKNATILLVEDEDALRRIALRSLARRGFRVIQAASAEEALEKLDAVGRIDLLVTDVVLPGMNGRRFAAMLTERYPEASVLYTSGHTNDEVLHNGVSRAEMSFLQKPYSTKVLVERVEEELERARRGALAPESQLRT